MVVVTGGDIFCGLLDNSRGSIRSKLYGRSRGKYRIFQGGNK